MQYAGIKRIRLISYMFSATSLIDKKIIRCEEIGFVILFNNAKDLNIDHRVLFAKQMKTGRAIKIHIYFKYT